MQEMESSVKFSRQLDAKREQLETLTSQEQQLKETLETLRAANDRMENRLVEKSDLLARLEAANRDKMVVHERQLQQIDLKTKRLEALRQENARLLMIEDQSLERQFQTLRCRSLLHIRGACLLGGDTELDLLKRVETSKLQVNEMEQANRQRVEDEGRALERQIGIKTKEVQDLEAKLGEIQQNANKQVD